MKPDVLVIVPPQAGLPPLAGFNVLQEDFTIHYASDAAEADRLIADVGARIRAVVCSNGIGLRGDQIRALPRLELIQTRGKGFERYDLDAAREKGVIVANSREVNFFCVAEHAMALLLMLARDIRADDRDVHEGRYKEARLRAPRQLIFGKRMGILGLGDIGAAIAKRAVAFDVAVRYHNRSKRTDVPYEYVETLGKLAAGSDILIVACPGGPATHGIVNREIIDAIDPQGFLVNVGRGSVVDNDALVQALHEKRLAGAALDVVDGEPEIPEAVLRAPNLIITPHVGSSALVSRMAGVQHAQENLLAHFSGRPIRDRVA